jgi:transposase InsO family protein
MAYSINPNLPKARAIAMRLLLLEQQPLLIVARKCGVHRSTIWRWQRKWLELNEHRQLDNPNRPNRPVGISKLASCKWSIATNSSRPHRSPHAICDQLVNRILDLRQKLNRCAEVIWHHLNYSDGIRISLSSVHRILRRNHAYDGSRKNRVRPDNPRRPHANVPGELVQTDTIHSICPYTYRRRYVYTVIDLYSRMAYAEIHNRILPGLASSVVLRAQTSWNIKIHMAQADNGPEFGRYFEQTLKRAGITTRHSRLGRPNDNAHIERFNRTIQEECLGSKISSSVATATLQKKIYQYIEHYNTNRVHLGLQLRVPTDMLQRS